MRGWIGAATAMAMAALLAALLAVAPAPAVARDVTVFAAASLKTALDAVAAAYAARTGARIRPVYAGSARLARQIQAGAPADLFLSANAAWMDVLARDGLLAAETRVDLLGNRLVLIAPTAAGRAPIALGPRMDLLGALGPDGRLAMALVDAVPAGLYGRAALAHYGVWPALRPRAAQADNVRAALALVARGEAPLGIVYASDARAEPKVAVLALFPPESHPPIVYPVAVLRDAADPAAARAFRAFLAGPAARALFEAQGFRALAPAAE